MYGNDIFSKSRCSLDDIKPATQVNIMSEVIDKMVNFHKSATIEHSSNVLWNWDNFTCDLRYELPIGANDYILLNKEYDNPTIAKLIKSFKSDTDGSVTLELDLFDFDVDLLAIHTKVLNKRWELVETVERCWVKEVLEIFPCILGTVRKGDKIVSLSNDTKCTVKEIKFPFFTQSRESIIVTIVTSDYLLSLPNALPKTFNDKIEPTTLSYLESVADLLYIKNVRNRSLSDHKHKGNSITDVMCKQVWPLLDDEEFFKSRFVAFSDIVTPTLHQQPTQSTKETLMLQVTKDYALTHLSNFSAKQCESQTLPYSLDLFIEINRTDDQTTLRTLLPLILSEITRVVRDVEALHTTIQALQKSRSLTIIGLSEESLSSTMFKVFKYVLNNMYGFKVYTLKEWTTNEQLVADWIATVGVEPGLDFQDDDSLSIYFDKHVNVQNWFEAPAFKVAENLHRLVVDNGNIQKTDEYEDLLHQLLIESLAAFNVSGTTFTATAIKPTPVKTKAPVVTKKPTKRIR